MLPNTNIIRLAKSTVDSQLLLGTRLPPAASHIHADRLPMIRDRQPSGPNHWSLLTAIHPTRGRSSYLCEG